MLNIIRIGGKLTKL